MQLIAKVAKKQVTVGRIAFLLANCPGIVYSALIFAGVADRSSLHLVFAILIFTILAFRRRDSFTSKLSKSLPRHSFLLLLYYFVVWTGLIAQGISSKPDFPAGFAIGAAIVSLGAMLPILFKIFRALMDAEKIRIVTDHLLSIAIDDDDRKDILSIREEVKRYP